MTIARPLILSACADCGVGTIRLGEWYLVRDDVWEQAWHARRKSWQRLGRTLVAADFTAASVNDPHKNIISERMRDRLVAADSTPLRRRRGGPKASKNKHREMPRDRPARAPLPRP
jgi:hypothetical protein